MLQALLLAGLGGALAIAGTVTGQHLQARHTQRTRIEEYSREDRYRLFRDRLEAYREYHVAIGNARREMAVYSRSNEDAELLETLKQARSEAWRAYTLVWLIGEEKVVDAASILLGMVDGVTSRLSWLRGEVFPGQAEDADFFGCWLVRARCLKSGGDDDAVASSGQYTESELPTSFGPAAGTPEQGVDDTFVLYAGPKSGR